DTASPDRNLGNKNPYFLFMASQGTTSPGCILGNKNPYISFHGLTGFNEKLKLDAQEYSISKKLESALIQRMQWP
ncbi:hypothetical protein HAX54_018364, partial [Datura stramonium]|nr:hypothetical protein [Datura stramonium]